MTSEPKKILVVDDEPDLLDILQFTLSNQGYGVFTASNSPEALKLLRTEAIDLLLTDVRMPGDDGLKLLAEGLSLNPKLVVVLMTGFSDLNSDEAGKLGAAALLQKPFDPGQLLRTIRRHLF